MDVQTIIDQAGSVGQLAARLGISHSTVCDWKRVGRIPGARAFQIASELNIPIEKLSSITTPPRGT